MGFEPTAARCLGERRECGKEHLVPVWKVRPLFETGLWKMLLLQEQKVQRNQKVGSLQGQAHLHGRADG